MFRQIVMTSAIILTQMACVPQTIPSIASLPRPVVPVVQQPVQPMLTTQLIGLQGEEIELQGIYDEAQPTAKLLLRNGETVSFFNPSGQLMASLPGVQARSAVRVRGQLRPLPPVAQTGPGRQSLGIVARNVWRI